MLSKTLMQDVPKIVEQIQEWVPHSKTRKKNSYRYM